MKIGELASHTNVNASTIRYYEKQGLLPEAKRTSTGYRLYHQADIKTINIIKLAQSFGFNLEEIGQLFASKAELDHQAVLSKLENKKKEITTLIKELHSREEQIDLLINDLMTTWSEGGCFEVTSN